jgi:2-oxopent-4-enoate hydratase
MNSQAADLLHQAQATRVPCEPLSKSFELTTQDAYAIQQLNIEKRLQNGLQGGPTRIIGRKVGLTSEAIQRWLNVNQPDFGTLLTDMWVPDGAVAPIGLLLQPRAEAEIAFVMKHDLAGPGILPTDVIRATDYVLPAIEIIDSRIADWKITYNDTIADNASSGLFVLGTTPRQLDGLDLRLCGAALRKNGTVESTGAGIACLGHPLHAVAWLANTLGAMGSGIRAGEVVLSGALGPVTPVKSGDYLVADIEGIGRCSVRFG